MTLSSRTSNLSFASSRASGVTSLLSIFVQRALGGMALTPACGTFSAVYTASVRVTHIFRCNALANEVRVVWKSPGRFLEDTLSRRYLNDLAIE